MSTTDPQLRRRLLAIGLSFLVGAGLMAVKFQAYRLTRSSAILSDALESIINVIASGFAFGSIVLAAKPPDSDHPYGHGKIEYFSAGFEGALIILAAVGIFHSAWQQFQHPRPLPHLDLGLALLLAAGAVNGLLGWFLVRTGRSTQSLALIADGRHVLTDVATSVGVLIGLVAVRFSGWILLDGLVAMLVGCQILYAGGHLVKTSYSGLMDASDPELLETIAELLDRHRQPLWIDIHRLRAWRSGNRVHADFHLILPATLSLDRVHREIKQLEAIFHEHFGGAAELLVHVDPCSDPDCPICSLAACADRKQELTGLKTWRQPQLTADREVDSGQ
ncbi:MAG: cation transporter [Syntrophobacteraceae bacterium CG2_30_61_12]|nr:MAG: cation transporter [Syntrophobacteraceae bacterium CG2_30_61_12]